MKLSHPIDLLEQGPPQSEERDGEVDHQSGDVDQRGHERGRRAGRVEADTEQR